MLLASYLLGLLFNAEYGDDMLLRNVISLHGITSQKTELFIVITARTSNPTAEIYI
jgi:hypothetical protein